LEGEGGGEGGGIWVMVESRFERPKILRKKIGILKNFNTCYMLACDDQIDALSPIFFEMALLARARRARACTTVLVLVVVLNLALEY
jgi:hypothetical protein